MIQHYLHSQMDLRPFMPLRLSRIREFLNGLSSKKRTFFLFAYQDHLLKMADNTDHETKKRPRARALWQQILSWRRRNQNYGCFPKSFRCRTHKEIPLFTQFLLRCAHFFGRRSLLNVSAFEVFFDKLTIRQVCACGHRLITEKCIARLEVVLARVLD